MIKRLKNLLNAASEPRSHDRDEKALAAAVLLVEAARMDESFDADERQTIRDILERHFQLVGAEAEDLITEAEAAQAESSHLLRFTRTIKDTFPFDERIEMIEMLWEVVYADGELHHYEANLLRRIGGLIYVPDRERGEARKRVMARLGIAEG